MASIAELRAKFGSAADGVTDSELYQIAEQAYAPLYADKAALQRELIGKDGGQWSNRLGASVDRYQSNLYGIGEALGSDWAGQQRKRNEDQADYQRLLAERQGAVSSYKDVNSVGTGLNYLGGLAVDSLPYLGEAAVGGLAMRGASVGLRAGVSAAKEMGMVDVAAQGTRQLATRSNIAGAAASYPSAVGDILSNQREQIEQNGGGQIDLMSAFAGGVPYAALNAFDPLNRAAATGSLAPRVGRLDGATGFTGGLQRTAMNAGRTGLMEGANETGQEVLNQYFGRMAVDPSAGLMDADALDRYGESFVGGAALGGAFGGAGGGWRRSDDWFRQQDLLQRDAMAQAQADKAQQDARALQAQQAAHQQSIALNGPDLLTGIDTNGLTRENVSPMPDYPAAPDMQAMVQRHQQLRGEMSGYDSMLQQVDGQINQAVDAGDMDSAQRLSNQRIQLMQYGSRASSELRQLDPLVQQHLAGAAQSQQSLDLRGGLLSADGQAPLFESGEAVEPGPHPEAVKALGSGASKRDLRLTSDLFKLVDDGKAAESEIIGLVNDIASGKGRRYAPAEKFINERTSAEPVVAGTAPVAPGAAVPPGAVAAGGNGNLVAGGGVAGAGVLPAAPAPVASGTAPVPVGSEPGADLFGALTDTGVRLRQEAKARAATEAPAKTKAEAESRATTKVDPTTGATVKVLPTVESDRKGNVDIEDEASAGFRKSFVGNLQRLSGDNRQVLERFLGVSVDENGALELTGENESYEQIGATLQNSKTRKLGMSKEAVRKRVNGALQAAGAPDGISPLQLFRKLGFQLSDLNLEAIERMTGGAAPKSTVDEAAQAEGQVSRLRGDADMSLGADESVEERNKDDEVVGEDGVGEAAEDVSLVSLDDERTSSLNEFIEDELASGAILPTDIEGARQVLDPRVWNKLPMSQRAQAVRVFSNARLAGDATATEITRSLNAERTEEAITGRAGPAPDTDAAEAAAGGGREGSQLGALAGGRDAGTGGVERQVEGSGPAPTVRVKRKLTVDSTPLPAAPRTAGKITLGKKPSTALAVVAPAPKAQPAAPDAIQTPKEQWEALQAQAPGMPAWDDLNGSQKGRWVDLAHRGNGNLAAADRIGSEVVVRQATQQAGSAPASKAAPAAIANDNVIENDADGKPLVTELTPAQQTLMLEESLKLSEPERRTLESQYGDDFGSDDFLAKLSEDVVRYVTKGAESVAQAVRSIVGKVAKAVLSVAVVFNLTAISPNLNSEAYARTAASIPIKTTVTAEVQLKQEGKADTGGRQLSPNAQKFVDWIAAQNRPSDVSQVVDPATGLMYVMKGGKIIADTPVLFGAKGIGEMPGGSMEAAYSMPIPESEKKVTPAGRFPASMGADAEYGSSITFAQHKGWRIAIHRVYLGNPQERRQQRLDSANSSDNAVSYGCVNVGSDFYDRVLAKQDYTGNAFAYLLPTDASALDQFIPTPNTSLRTTRTTTTANDSATAPAGRDGGIDYAERRRPAATAGRQRAQFSKAGKGGSNVARVMTELSKLGLKLSPNKIMVVQSATDLPANLQRSMRDEGADPSRVQGFVFDGRAYLIADNIKPGAARSVFLHEVGSHLGLDELLSDGEMLRLVTKINSWAGKGDGSIESQIAKKAVARVTNAKTDNSQLMSELIAYFVEEAVNAGIDPTAMQYKSEIGRWMQALVAALKGGLAKLGMGGVNLTAQDVVDMAYGAAHVALNVDSQTTAGGKASIADALSFSTAAEDATAARVLAGMPQPARDAFTRIRDTFKKLSPWVLTNYQLAKEFGAGTAANISSLTKYMVQSAAAATDRTRMQREFHDISVEWDKLPKAIKDSLHGVMQRATMDEMHPDLAFNAKDNAHLVSPDATKNAAALAKHAALESAYNALPKAAKDVYQSAKKALQDSWDQRAQAYFDLVDESYRESLEEAMADGDQERVEKVTKDAAAARRDYAKQMGKIKGPYFPLMRFGEYLAVGESAEYLAAVDELAQAKGEARGKAQAKVDTLKTDPAHYRVSAHDDIVAMRNATAVMRAAGLKAREDMAGLKLDHLRPATQDTVKHVVDAVNRKIGDGKLAGEVKDVVTQLYLQGLPEMSALRREAQRKGVTGASIDMLRAFSASGESNAFYTSRLRHAKDMAETMLEMKAQVKGDVDLMHVHREMQKRMSLDMRFTRTPVQDTASALTWAYQLGTSPAFVLINGLQPFLVTGPVLAGKFGLGNTTKAMGAAYRDSLTVLKQARWKDGKWDWWSGIDESSIPGPSRSEDRAAIRQLMQRGILDEGMHHDLNMFANDGSRGMAKVNRAMGWATQQVEVVNRMSTALAAFRLARKDGMTEAAAVEFAYDMVQGTQFDYSSEGTARIMREGGGVPLAKLVFQFRRYQQGMLYLLGSNIRKSFGSGDEAKAARGAVAYLTLATGAMAGASGLPLIGVGFFLSNLMRDDDDEDGDAQTHMRNWLFDMTGDKDMATALAKGLPAMLGMDISKRVGLADIAALLPMARYEQAKTGRDAVSETLLNAAGPSAGLAGQIVEGVRLISNGDFVKGAEKMVPKSAADIIKAARYATKGFTDGKGEEVLGADEIGAWNITLRGLGVASTQEANYYEGTKAKKNLETAVNTRKGEIGSAFRAALKSGDMEDVREMIDEFNADHPDAAIKPKDEVSWRRDAVKRERNREDSGLSMDPKRDKNYEAITRFAR